MSTPARVREWLHKQEFTVMSFQQRTATVETAAAAVGCTVAEIAKTLLFMVGSKPVAVVTSGDMKVNSSLLKKHFHLSGKVVLPRDEQVRRITGFAPGGVSPFLLPPDLPLVLDVSLQRFATIYPAAGDDYSAVPISPLQLQRLTTADFANLCQSSPHSLD